MKTSYSPRIDCVFSLTHRQMKGRINMMMENRMMTGNRVDCLYRVSTDKQVDYNDKSQADIPMQRRECHRFCEKMGWTIVHEEQEDGVSGHKVRAENRDKLQIIKERAKQGKFDILLVFIVKFSSSMAASCGELISGVRM